MLLVTGGAGFIGSNFVLAAVAAGESVVNLDKLGYAGHLESLAALEGNPRHVFVKGDICDRALVRKLLAQHQPRALVHFAAESHVDRSIHGPGEFVQTNVVGTFSLLEEARNYSKAGFRFLNVSTDEVFGSLGESDAAFTEKTPYAPNSPYSASKAAADHQTYCLVDQGFVKRNSEVSVKEHVAQIGQQLGEEITIRRFVRFQVGEAV